MKRFITLTFAMFLFTVCGFAADKNNTSIILTGPTTVGGKALPAGDYKLQWKDANATQVDVLKGSKVVATVPAKVVEESNANDGSVEMNTIGGVKTVATVRAKHATLQFDQGSTAAGN